MVKLEERFSSEIRRLVSVVQDSVSDDISCQLNELIHILDSDITDSSVERFQFVIIKFIILNNESYLRIRTVLDLVTCFNLLSLNLCIESSLHMSTHNEVFFNGWLNHEHYTMKNLKELKLC